MWYTNQKRVGTHLPRLLRINENHFAFPRERRVCTFAHPTFNQLKELQLMTEQDKQETLDGEIFVDEAPEFSPEDWDDDADADAWEPGAPLPFLIADKAFLKADAQATAASRTIYQRKLATWRDPTSIEFKNKCVDWIVIGGFKTCRGWRQYTRIRVNTAVLTVKTATPQNLQNVIADCMRQSAVVGAVAAIVSGGTAALTAAERAFQACLAVKLGAELISVSVNVKTQKTKWSKV